MHAERDHPYVRRRCHHPPGGLDPIQFRHRDIHHHDIGLQLVGELHRLAAVRRLADDLHIGLRAQYHFEALPHDGVIVNQQDANSFHALGFLLKGYANLNYNTLARLRLHADVTACTARPRPHPDQPESAPAVRLKAAVVGDRSDFARPAPSLMQHASPACRAMLVRASCAIRNRCVSVSSGRRPP
jgi:hypothetical protein